MIRAARRRAAGGRIGFGPGMKGQPQVLRHGATHVCDSDRAAVADRGRLAIRTSRERSTSAEPLRGRMQPPDQARTEVRDAHLADYTGMYSMLESVAVPESSSVPEASAHDQLVEDLRALIEGAVRREVGALRREMNVRLEAFGAMFDAKIEALKAKFDAKFKALEAKFDAKFEALEAKIEALDAKFEAKFEALQFQIKMMRWVLGIVVVMQIAMFGMMYRLVFFEDRSRTPPPPPPSPTLQAPAGTEAESTTGTGPGQGASAIAARDGSSGTADPAADPPTP